MSQIVTADSVLLSQHAGSREEALTLISQKAAELGIADDADALFSAFVARENMGETGMTDGFAVPHAKTDAIKRAAVIVVKNNRALEWPSFDDKPVDVAISLLVPDGEAGTTHIKLLTKTAVLLMREEIKNLVRSTDDRKAIADAINAGIEED